VSSVWTTRTRWGSDLPATAEYPADREAREARERRLPMRRLPIDQRNYEELRRLANKAAKRVRKGEL